MWISQSDSRLLRCQISLEQGLILKFTETLQGLSIDFKKVCTLLRLCFDSYMLEMTDHGAVDTIETLLKNKFKILTLKFLIYPKSVIEFECSWQRGGSCCFSKVYGRILFSFQNQNQHFVWLCKFLFFNSSL